MYVKATLAALAIAVAAPAFASDSLARSVGVEPGVYTTSQLVTLKSAIESDDVITANFIRSQAGDEGVLSTRGQANVSDFTIAHAAENDEQAVVTFLTAKANGEIASPVPGSQGHVALANSLGLDWQAYTLSELVTIKSDLESDD